MEDQVLNGASQRYLIGKDHSIENDDRYSNVRVRIGGIIVPERYHNNYQPFTNKLAGKVDKQFIVRKAAAGALCVPHVPVQYHAL